MDIWFTSFSISVISSLRQAALPYALVLLLRSARPGCRPTGPLLGGVKQNSPAMQGS